MMLSHIVLDATYSSQMCSRLNSLALQRAIQLADLTVLNRHNKFGRNLIIDKEDAYVSDWRQWCNTGIAFLNAVSWRSK
jgi:hypothetical protein